jgi:hypothetical protein
MWTKLFSFCLLFVLPTLYSYAQTLSVTISGSTKNQADKSDLPFVNLVVKKEKDSTFVTGTVSNEEGRFSLANIASGEYILELSYAGFQTKTQPILVGSLSPFLDLGTIELQPDSRQLQEVVLTSKEEELSNRMDKKTFQVAANISQSGGSVLQALKGLPGITTSQEGKVELRGSDKVAILIDGRQTALTGFGSQTGLDNIPASNIEKIEIIMMRMAMRVSLTSSTKKARRKVSTGRLVWRQASAPYGKKGKISLASAHNTGARQRSTRPFR